MTLRRWTPLACALFALLFFPPAGSAQPDVASDALVLETTVFHDEATTQAHFARLRSFLEERTGRRYVLVMAPDYSTASEDVRRGDADLALLSPLLTCKTRRRIADVRYVATSRINEKGSWYRSVVFTRADGPVRSLEEARGQAIALVSEQSAAGYLFPMDRMLQLGFDPFTHFRKVYLVGTHAAAVEAVALGSVPIAAAFRDALSTGGPAERFRVLEESDRIPSASLLASPYLASDVVDAVRAALLLPEYREHVASPAGGPGDAYADFGWQVIDDAVLDAPCAVEDHLRAARRGEGGGR